MRRGAEKAEIIPFEPDLDNTSGGSANRNLLDPTHAFFKCVGIFVYWEGGKEEKLVPCIKFTLRVPVGWKSTIKTGGK